MGGGSWARAFRYMVQCSRLSPRRDPPIAPIAPTDPPREGRCRRAVAPVPPPAAGHVRIATAALVAPSVAMRVLVSWRPLHSTPLRLTRRVQIVEARCGSGVKLLQSRAVDGGGGNSFFGERGFFWRQNFLCPPFLCFANCAQTTTTAAHTSVRTSQL